MRALSFSIVIPVLNEVSYVGPTLEAVRAAFDALPSERSVSVDLLVVDNGSEDDTAAVARHHGARVVLEAKRSAARARNAGARAAAGWLLVFLDADVLVPRSFAFTLVECASDPACLGGAFDTDQRPRRGVLRVYLALWRVLGFVFDMAQGLWTNPAVVALLRRRPYGVAWLARRTTAIMVGS